MSSVMRRLSVFVAAIVLCVAASCFVTGGATAVAADETGSHWVTVDFKEKVNLKWDWNDLLQQNATQEKKSTDLALAGLVMSRQAELSSAKVEAVLEKLGFSDLKSGNYRFSTEDRNDVSKPAHTFGHKAITKDGKTYHIVCAVFKGTTTLDDAITDINSIRDGFYFAGKNCEEALAAYVNGISGATKDNTILFITGHSLGASTANVVGRLSGDLANDNSKYVYTFASPNYEVGDDKDKGPFNNFFTLTNTKDAVPKVPLTFRKIGLEKPFDFDTLDAAHNKRFENAYVYFTGKSYEEDTKVLGTLKNHLCETYMSFVLSDLTDAEASLHTQSRDNTLTVEGKTATVTHGEAATLASSDVLDVKDAKGSVSYAKVSGDDNITVAADGKVTANKGLKLGIHRVKVAVTAAGDDFYTPKTATATFKIHVKLANPLDVIGKSVTVPSGVETIVETIEALTIKGSTGGLVFEKVSGNKNITVSKSGKITVGKKLAPGTYRVGIKVTSTGKGKFASKSVTRTVKIVVKPSGHIANPIVVNGKTASVVVGKKSTLKRTAVLEVEKAKGKVTYAKKSGNAKIKIAKNGKVTVNKGLKPGTYKVRVAVKAAGNKIYKAKTVTTNIRIKVKKANTITVKGKTTKVAAGKKVTLKPAKVLTVKKAQGKLTFAKKSGNGKIKIAKNGKVTVSKGLKAGTYKVKVAVKAAGNGKYMPKTVTKVFKITVKAPASAKTQATTSSGQLTAAQARSGL